MTQTCPSSLWAPNPGERLLGLGSGQTIVCDGPQGATLDAAAANRIIEGEGDGLPRST